MMTETTENSIRKEIRKRSDDHCSNTTPNRIIIQTRDESYTFDKGTYREDYLRPFISEKEYDDIIAKASRIMGDSWTKKRKNDQIKLPIWVTILSGVSVLLIIIYMVLLYLSPTSSNGTTMLVGSIICISLASLIIFSLSIYNFCRKIGTFKTLEEIIKEDLEEYCGKVNEKFQGNVEFKYNTNKRWIVCNVKKITMEKSDKEEKKNFITEEVEEDPEKENANEEDELKKTFKKNSRAQSIAGIPKLHSKTPSITKNVLHSRGQSHVVVNRIDELELTNIEY